METKKMLVVDGNSIINRAFYGVRPLTTSDGLHTNALFGMINILDKQMASLKPDYAIVAFDLKEPTFRHKMYAEYKAGRHAMPEELAVQFPVAKNVLKTMGFNLIEIPGYEADDIIGTLSEYAADDLIVYILTGDRDSLQLISDNVHVLLATNNDTINFETETFMNKYGVLPSQYVDVKALMGDSSDNIPGIKGIGEKTALKLIKEYGSLDGLYEALKDAKLSPSVYSKIENGKESAYMSQALAKICRSVPLNRKLDDFIYLGIDKPAAYKLFERLEFSSFIKRFSLSEDKTPKQSSDTTLYEVFDASENDIIKIISDEALLSLQLADNMLLLFDGAKLMRVRLSSDDMIKTEISSDLLARLLVSSNKKVICNDCKAVYKALETYDIHFRDCAFDVMLAAYVINSNEGSYDISRLTIEYLNESHSDGVPDVVYTFRLYQPLMEIIETNGMKSLLIDIEMPLAAVLADMELSGFRIDSLGMRAYGEMLSLSASEYEQRIYIEAGEQFNINSPKQLGEILFDRLNLPHSKKTKTGYSTNAEVLEKLRAYHPIVEDILEYRKVTKLKSTYVDGLLRQADADGRVHTTFKQTGTATGRLSSTEPNLQNIPIKTDLGKIMRKYFVAENENYVLIDADYSQIELRLLSHISGDKAMKDAFLNGIDIHTSTASAVFGVPTDMVTYDMRKRAKVINFGILYGMGEYTLANDLKTTRAKAGDYIKNYLASYPGISRYLTDIKQYAYDNGFVTTLYGRRRYIPELSGHNKKLRAFGERVAMNSPIQGTAADIIKIAMINVSKRLKQEGINAKLILQIHDELLIESEKQCANKAKQILCEEMEAASSLSIPLTVETDMGINWYYE